MPDRTLPDYRPTFSGAPDSGVGGAGPERERAMPGRRCWPVLAGVYLCIVGKTGSSQYRGTAAGARMDRRDVVPKWVVWDAM